MFILTHLQWAPVQKTQETFFFFFFSVTFSTYMKYNYSTQIFHYVSEI